MWVVGVVGAARAAGLELPAAADTTVFEESGALSNGAGLVVHAGANSAGDARRALLRFDTSAIPSGSTVTAVTLHLSVDQAGGAGAPLDVSLRPLTRSWGEAGSSTGGGSGAPAQPGDATWTSAFHPSDAWTSPGGDAGPASATTVVSGIGPYAWAGAGLVADVQAWVDGAPSDGWLLAADDEVTPQTAKRFPSSEAAIDPPRLDVQFTPGPLGIGPPVPGTAGVANTVTVTNALAGLDVVLVASGRPGATPIPGCPGSVAMANPQVLGTVVADATGEATFVAQVPAGAAGRAVRLQAVQPGTCAQSPASVASF